MPDRPPGQSPAGTAPVQGPGPWKTADEQDPLSLGSLTHCESADYRVEIQFRKIKIWRTMEKMFNLILCPLQICSSFLFKEFKSGLCITYIDLEIFMLVYLKG